MIDMRLMDKVISLDHQKMQVTVEAGITVHQLLEYLRPFGLTLQNYASIDEQQIGGFIQVGAHGTGAQIPPVDDQVISIRFIPAIGNPQPLSVSIDDTDPENQQLFHFAKLSLGLFGVVTQVTLQLVPLQRLIERTFVLSREQIRNQHLQLLKSHKHIRYMWLPYTDDVVVVACDPISPEEELSLTFQSHVSPEERKRKTKNQLDPALRLLLECDPSRTSDPNLNSYSYFQLRDLLLSLDPLNPHFVQRINKVEAEFWRANEGFRVDTSDRILGFDCGGQQWVSEVAFPSGTLTRPSGADLAFMEELLGLIEEREIAAPCPIEQRWTAQSHSPMSPASTIPPLSSSPTDDEVFSWVGIIMYLPERQLVFSDESNNPLRYIDTSEPIRHAITAKFVEYRNMCEDLLWDRFKAHQHWAKIELHSPHFEEKEVDQRNKRLIQRIRQRFDVERFNLYRDRFDPKRVLSNHLTDALFSESKQ